MKTTIAFKGYNKNIRRHSYITLELKKNLKGETVFTASGVMRGCAGQCLDTIRKYNSDPLFLEIHSFWKKYHLNDMHAGTEEQEKIIDKYLKKNNLKYSYDLACDILEKAGKYIDNGYRYGTAWLYREIPVEDIQRIGEIILENTNK